MIGRLIHPYRIDRLLGEGGMGKVFLATDTLLDRPVALKMLQAELLTQPSFLERFKSEAQILARLNHPNVAGLYNFVREEGDYFMVMEFVEGDTLEHWLDRYGPLPYPLAVSIIMQATDGLFHAHKRNILHRDLKPANLMVTPDGVVKLTDFGIARIMGSQHLTQVNGMVGTPCYMAPEQILGKEPSPQSDIHALSVVLYELLSGQVPFAGASHYQTMERVTTFVLPDLRLTLPDLPADLDAVLQRGLRKDPAERYATVREFQKALASIVPYDSILDEEAVAQYQRPVIGPGQPIVISAVVNSPEPQTPDVVTPTEVETPAEKQPVVQPVVISRPPESVAIPTPTAKPAPPEPVAVQPAITRPVIVRPPQPEPVVTPPPAAQPPIARPSQPEPIVTPTPTARPAPVSPVLTQVDGISSAVTQVDRLVPPPAKPQPANTESTKPPTALPPRMMPPDTANQLPVQRPNRSRLLAFIALAFVVLIGLFWFIGRSKSDVGGKEVVSSEMPVTDLPVSDNSNPTGTNLIQPGTSAATGANGPGSTGSSGHSPVAGSTNKTTENLANNTRPADNQPNGTELPPTAKDAIQPEGTRSIASTENGSDANPATSPVPANTEAKTESRPEPVRPDPSPAVESARPMNAGSSRNRQLGSGSEVVVALQETISAATAKEGQSITMRVAKAVSLNGEVLIPAGAEVRGDITGVDTGGKKEMLELRVRSIQTDGQPVLLRGATFKYVGSKGESVQFKSGQQFMVYTAYRHSF